MKIEEALLWFSDLGIYILAQCELDETVLKTLMFLTTAVKPVYHNALNLGALKNQHTALIEVNNILNYQKYYQLYEFLFENSVCFSMFYMLSRVQCKYRLVTLLKFLVVPILLGPGRRRIIFTRGIHYVHTS